MIAKTRSVSRTRFCSITANSKVGRHVGSWLQMGFVAVTSSKIQILKFPPVHKSRDTFPTFCQNLGLVSVIRSEKIGDFEYGFWTLTRPNFKILTWYEGALLLLL